MYYLDGVLCKKCVTIINVTSISWQHLSPPGSLSMLPSRMLPQRSWAGSIPTVLTHEALNKLLSPSFPPGGGPMPGIRCCPLERFLCCMYQRKFLQRTIQTEDSVSVCNSYHYLANLFHSSICRLPTITDVFHYHVFAVCQKLLAAISWKSFKNFFSNFALAYVRLLPLCMMNLYLI